MSRLLTHSASFLDRVIPRSVGLAACDPFFWSFPQLFSDADGSLTYRGGGRFAYRASEISEREIGRLEMAVAILPVFVSLGIALVIEMLGGETLLVDAAVLSWVVFALLTARSLGEVTVRHVGGG